MLLSTLLEQLLSGLPTPTHTHTETPGNKMFVAFYLRGHRKGLFPVDEAFGLQPALFSSKLVISFLSECMVESRPGRRRITHMPVKKQSPSGQKEEGQRGVERESEGGVEGFFLKKKKKKHLEKQSGINKQAGFHCPPNK